MYYFIILSQLRCSKQDLEPSSTFPSLLTQVTLRAAKLASYSENVTSESSFRPDVLARPANPGEKGSKGSARTNFTYNTFWPHLLCRSTAMGQAKLVNAGSTIHIIDWHNGNSWFSSDKTCICCGGSAIVEVIDLFISNDNEWVVR